MNNREVAMLDRESARGLVNRMKASSEELWHMMLEAYEGGAHTALGYPSWWAFWEAEFGGSKAHAYHLLDAGRVVQAIEGAGLSHKTEERPTQEQAIALAPLAKTQPEEAARVWGDIVEESQHTGQGVTAEKVRAKVEERKAPDVPWSNDELRLQELLNAGETIVVSMAKDGHPNLVAWAKREGVFVRIDRASEWGNPFEVGKDGARETVVDNYDLYYLPHKPSLLKQLDELKGKALGCWCAPRLCHGHVLRERITGGGICRA